MTGEARALKPRIRLYAGRDVAVGDYRWVSPFRRSWIAIAVVAAMDAVFLVPAITTFRRAAEEWGHFESLFDLVGALFLSGWLLGWCIAPLLLTTLLTLMVFGRETLSATPDAVRIVIGVPFLGVAAEYDPSRMRDLRATVPEPKSPTSWRGPHLTFDYAGSQGAFGSDLDDFAVAEIRAGLNFATGGALGRGGIREPAAPEPGAAAEEPLVPVTTPPPAIEPAKAAAPLSLSSPSTLALIAANLVPIAGAAVLGWKLSDVMVVFWAESAVVGLFNCLKMAVIGRWLALAAIPFFIGHFGAFMAVHFLFLYGLFVEGPSAMGGGDLADVARLFAGLWPALLALFVSHGFSFFYNFLGRGEYRTRDLSDQMSEPYSRIIFMHLVLILGGGITLVLGEPTPVLLAVIALKIVADVRAHLHQRAAAGQGEQD